MKVFFNFIYNIDSASTYTWESVHVLKDHTQSDAS